MLPAAGIWKKAGNHHSHHTQTCTSHTQKDKDHTGKANTSGAADPFGAAKMLCDAKQHELEKPALLPKPM